MSKRGISNEPLVWLPFSGGGMLAAMLIPVHIILFGIAIPLGIFADPGQASLLRIVEHPVAKLYLFALLAGCFFHWAHRFRYTLFDLGIRGAKKPIAFGCYGAAVVGTIWTAIVLL